jgi:hypothetical protein
MASRHRQIQPYARDRLRQSRCGGAARREHLAISPAVEHARLYYALDPSSQIACTIGATPRAGGVHCLRSQRCARRERHRRRDGLVGGGLRRRPHGVAPGLPQSAGNRGVPAAFRLEGVLPSVAQRCRMLSTLLKDFGEPSSNRRSGLAGLVAGDSRRGAICGAEASRPLCRVSTKPMKGPQIAAQDCHGVRRRAGDL